MTKPQFDYFACLAILLLHRASVADQEDARAELNMLSCLAGVIAACICGRPD